MATRRERMPGGIVELPYGGRLAMSVRTDPGCVRSCASVIPPIATAEAVARKPRRDKVDVVADWSDMFDLLRGKRRSVRSGTVRNEPYGNSSDDAPFLAAVLEAAHASTDQRTPRENRSVRGTAPDYSPASGAPAGGRGPGLSTWADEKSARWPRFSCLQPSLSRSESSLTK